MINSVTNKMTFYDLVTLIVPSALVCYVWYFPNIAFPDTWIGYVAEFGFVLLLGIVLKNFGAWWGSCWFRNNTDIIKEEEEKQDEGNYKFSFCSFLHTWLCDPIRYMFGPLIKLFRPKERDKAKLEEYDKMYDKAYKDSYYGHRIETLESHVAFLQTWTWAIIVCLFGQMKCFDNVEEINIFLFSLGLYVSIVLMLSIQRKIYYMVWESQKYVSEVSSKDSENPNYELSEFNRNLIKTNEQIQKNIDAQTTKVNEVSDKISAMTKQLLNK